MASPFPFLLRRLRLRLRVRSQQIPRPLSTCTSDDEDVDVDLDLKSRLLRLRFPKRSATAALQRWVSQGREAPPAQLREAVRDLTRCARYKHALEVSEWMKLHHESHLLGNDYAIRIDLLTKVFGLNSAEQFFNCLTPKPTEAYTAMLHHLASSKSVHKAEKLFAQMKTQILSMDSMPFNELMTLYISVGQPDKVFPVVTEMRRLKVRLDLYTYNLWISARAAIMDFKGVWEVLSEMERDPNSDQRWDIYRKLVQVYTNVGRFEEATSSTNLIEADAKVSVREWITYDLLLILHASLGNKGRIKEMWRCMKMSPGKMTYRSYICVISSNLVIAELEEAGEVIDQWQSMGPEFDISACTRLYDAFLKVDLMEIAENFRKLMHEKNYEIKTST